jgi:CDP-diacylglycerol pyrophosphatase
MNRTKLIAGGALLAVALAAGTATWTHSRSALWRIVSSDCAPAQAAGGSSKCAVVSPERPGAPGYAVLKDRRGVLQYLLIPTRRVSGIEDPALLEPGAGTYLSAAWREHRWMDVSNHVPVPREDVALALNSAWSRSQDQLHVHISCVRADLRERLRTLDGAVGEQWTTLPGGWQGHPYLVRRLVADSLDGTDLFREVAQMSHDSMGQQAIAVVGGDFQGKPGFWLLESHVEFTSGWLGGIEGDVQDHGCAVLGAGARKS